MSWFRLNFTPRCCNFASVFPSPKKYMYSKVEVNPCNFLFTVDGWVDGELVSLLCCVFFDARSKLKFGTIPSQPSWIFANNENNKLIHFFIDAIDTDIQRTSSFLHRNCFISSYCIILLLPRIYLPSFCILSVTE